MPTDPVTNGAPRPAVATAVVRSAIAPMHGEPGVGSPMISQQLAGHRVEIVDQTEDWVRGRGRDDYEGWIHRGFLTGDTELALSDDDAPAPRVSLGCTTDRGNGRRRRLPLLAFLAPGERVTSGEALEPEELARRFPPVAAEITRSAQEFFMATSYLWGGITPWGADCSGLVQSVFALHGLSIPRDAWQQAESGVDAGADVGELRAADLLFFSDRDDRRATHVGISLGRRRMVHLALWRGGYAVERLDDRRDPYVDRLRDRFLFARRVL